MVDICYITSNNYICAKKDVISGINTYTIKSDEARIANELMNTNYINFDISKSEISLTANSSNHYFWADERAHCSEKWQDWFCVPNYHNNNNVKKYPNSKTMSVGVCYTACPGGYTTSGINKCNLYEATNDDLIYNPLAIIALFGTNFYINYNPDNNLKYYTDIRDTIGIRGSYLNDLYRVNNNNKFITSAYINVAKNIPIAFPNAPTVVFEGGVADGATPATAATAKAFVIDTEIKSIRMTSGGRGYTSAPTVKFTGGTGTGAIAIASLDTRVSAVNIPVGSGGTGYTSAPTVEITDATGRGAYAIATIENGVVSKITVISGGSGYTTQPEVSITGGGAPTSNATATVLTETFVSNVEITAGGSGYTSDTTNQEKLLLNIINKFVNTGRDDAKKTTGVMNATISAIKADIKIALNNFITTYNITKIKDNEDALNKIYNRISNYKFDINKLDKLYGKDKNGNRKFVNIIAYAYNIMHLLLYDDNKLADTKIIETRINVLISIISTTLGYDKEFKIQEIIRKIFRKAFINCFKVNFDIFDKYMKKHLYKGDVMRIFDTTEIKFDDIYFKKCEFQDNLKEIIVPPYEIPYYNNLTFYDHRLLSEYSENTKYIIQILIIFGISLAITLVILGVYRILIWLALLVYNGVKAKRFHIIHKFTNFINYIFLFYNSFIFLIVKYTCVLYYFLFCILSKSNITLVYIICNLLNLALIIFLIGYSFASILELLNIDYIDLLSNIKLTGGGIVIPAAYNGVFTKVIRYFVILYCIMIYLYCAYLVRYGLNESQYDILSNPDADFNISINYISNILLSQYSTDILSNINAIYTDEELAAAANDQGVLKKMDAFKEASAEAAALNQQSIGGTDERTVIVSGVSFGNVNGDVNGDVGDVNNMFSKIQGEGKGFDLNNALAQGEGKGFDLNNALAQGNGKGNVDLSKMDFNALANGDTKSVDLSQFQSNGKGNVDLSQLESNPEMQNIASQFGVSFGK